MVQGERIKMKNISETVNQILKTAQTNVDLSVRWYGFPNYSDRQEIDKILSLAMDLQSTSGGVSETSADPERARDKMNKIMLDMLRSMRKIKKSFGLKVNP